MSLKLTSGQREIYTFIKTRIMAGTQFFAFVSGAAGTGKSVLIKYIVKYLPVHTAILTYTNQAASNVRGQTIHNAFGWQIGAHTSPALSMPIAGASLIIVDEVSMVSAGILDDMNLALQKMTGLDLPMGGKSIVVLGDFNQLPPVRAMPAYTSALWHLFSENTFVLDKILRQRDDAFSAACTAYIQDRTVSDVLTARVGVLPPLYMENGIHLFYRNCDVDECNVAVVESLELPKADAIEFTFMGSKKIQTRRTLYIGARYTLSEKYHQYVKGTMCTLLKISGAYITVRIGAVDVKMPRVTLHAGKLRKCVFGVRLGYASTVHKAQGQSFESVAVYTQKMSTQLFYVAITRCRDINQLYIIGDIPTPTLDYDKLSKSIFGLNKEI